MKITELELHNFTHFRVANIKKLYIHMESPIQIILGTNGCGKTRLINECTPLPAIRSNYDDGGYKRITIHHGSSEYILTSDFSNKSSPHSFMKDGIELNDGGTTNVQQDLAKDHLGYTSEIESICRVKYEFSKMACGARETLLMKLNPYKVNFMLTEYKLICSKIKACKNNLTRLYERKTLLENNFLDKSVVKEMKTESHTLNQEIGVTVELIHRIEDHLLHLKRSLTEISYTGYSLESVRSEILETARKSIMFHDIDRKKDPSETRAELENSLTQDRTKSDLLLVQIDEYISEINGYQSSLDTIESAQVGGAQLAQEISDIQMSLQILEEHVIERPYRKERCDHLKEVISDIQRIVSEFLDLPLKLIPEDVYTRKSQHLNRHGYLLNRYEQELTSCISKLDDLNTRQKIKLKDIPDTCDRQACPLFTHFKTRYDTAAQERALLESRISFLTKKRDRLRVYVEALDMQLKSMDRYRPYILQLMTYLKQYPDLKETLGTIDLYQTLQMSPVKIYLDLQEYLSLSISTHEYHDLTHQLHEKTAMKVRLQQADVTEKEFLLKIVEDKQTKLDQAKSVLNALEIRIKKTLDQINKVSLYTHTVSQLKDQQSILDGLSTHAMITHEISVFSDLKSILVEMRIKSVARLGDIDRIIKEQDILTARYEEEVIDQIKVIEDQKAHLSKLEKALSPNTGIPRDYMVTYINAILDTMNYYASCVFSYPFELVLIDKDDPLDYKFKVMANDVQVPDISLCSAAQRELIDLVFTLAQIKHKKLQDYPLYLDESGRAFDEYHKQQLIHLMKLVVDEGLVSQLFLINHHATVHEGLTNSNILVLNDANIVTPPVYNTHVKITI